MIAKDVIARVARGAALLDEERAGWWRTIDLDALDLNNACGCVLGQVFADHAADPHESGYDWALANLGEGDWVRGFGFLVPAGLTPAEEAAAFAALTEAWRSLIEERRRVAVRA